MRIIRPRYEIIETTTYEEMLKIVERAYRICYASEPKSDPEKFIESKIKIGHESPIEHCSVTVEFTFDRGVSHEIVRHRIASFSQQSTRYCNYNKDRFGNQIKVIDPIFFDPNEEKRIVFFPFLASNTVGKTTFWKLDSNLNFQINKFAMNKFDVWFVTCMMSEWGYMQLLEMGAKPEEARTVLPNSLATKILVTFNLREWRHVFNLRALGTTGRTHLQMVEVMEPLLKDFKKRYVVFFQDLK